MRPLEKDADKNILRIKSCLWISRSVSGHAGPVVKVAGVKLAGAEQHRVEGILDDGFLLVCIKSGSNDIPGMIIYCGGQISFYTCSVFPDGKRRPVFYIALQKHHPVRLAEPSGRTFPGLFVSAHVFRPKTGIEKMPFQS